MNGLRKLFRKIYFLHIFYHTAWVLLGAVFYRFPSKKIFVVGVTGTKGKSTTVELISFILEKAGKKTAAVSSVSLKIGGEISGNLTGNTMPGRFFIQKFLRRAVDNNCQYAVVEVTSEGVSANRHLFVDWQAAVFINLHPEHIETHGSFEKYREAKLKFFRSAKKLFFINEDDENADYFIKAAGGKEIILFGKSELESNLVGDFNKYNVGAAVAFVKSQGVSDEIIKRAVSGFPGVPGRMEFVHRPTKEKPFTAVVDYAHTPDSLRNVYTTLRRESEISKLICVLGAAGGGRDKWKRPEMGKIAAEFCDEVILTDEDPYNENPFSILEDIEKGFSENPNNKTQMTKLYKILDRGEAIKKAVELAGVGDIVIITGKGSEKFIRVAKGKKMPWSDGDAIESACRELEK